MKLSPVNRIARYNAQENVAAVRDVTYARRIAKERGIDAVRVTFEWQDALGCPNMVNFMVDGVEVESTNDLHIVRTKEGR
jgi:hypothetical protein